MNNKRIDRRGKRYLFFPALALYWGILPAGLILLSRRLDSAVSFPGIPRAVGLGIGIPLVSGAIIGACWCLVAFYLRGGGLPLAICPPVRLVREGPYAVSRNPLYISFTAYLLGLGLITGSTAAIGIVIPSFTTIWIVYALVHEERGIARRYGPSYADYKKEVPFLLRFRKGIPGPGIVFSLVYLIGKLIVRVFFPIEVTGKEHLPQSGPYIILANHASYLDPVLLIAASDRYIRFLTTAEMMRTRFGRWFFKAVGTIPTRRYQVDPSSVRAFLSALKAGEITGVFPEGERTWDGAPQPISETVKRLLRRAGVPLVAAQIDGSYAVYPRWSGYPLPGRIRVRFFPPTPPEKASEALSRISVPSSGRTWLPRGCHGLERLVWACPSCHAIGRISAHGRTIHCRYCDTRWSLTRDLSVRSEDGEIVPLREFTRFLDEGDPFAGADTLASIGTVDLLAGGDGLSQIASGEVTYENGALHVEGNKFPLSGARILRVEGRDRLDIGFIEGRRVRLKFQRDSPLKWERFLQSRPGIGPEEGPRRTREGDRTGHLR